MAAEKNDVKKTTDNASNANTSSASTSISNATINASESPEMSPAERQARDRKLLLEFHNVDFYKGTIEENAAKLTKLKMVILQGVKIDQEDERGNTMLDYAIDARNFFLGLELIIMGAEKCKNINLMHYESGNPKNAMLITDTKEWASRFLQKGIKIKKEDWAEIMKSCEKTNQKFPGDHTFQWINQSMKGMELLEENIQNQIKVKRDEWEKVAKKIQDTLAKALKALATKENEMKTTLLPKLRNIIKGLCSRQKTMAPSLIIFQTQLIQLLEAAFKDTTIGSQIFQGAFNQEFIKKCVKEFPFSPELESYFISLCFSVLEKGLQRIERFINENLKNFTVPGANKLTNDFFKDFHKSNNKIISDIKKLLSPLTADFHRDLIENFSGFDNSETLPAFSETECQKFSDKLKKHYEVRERMLKSHLQQKGKDSPFLDILLEFVDKILQNNKKGMFAGVEDWQRTYKEDGSKVFIICSSIKSDLPRIFQKFQVQFEKMLDLIQGIQQSEGNDAQKREQVKRLLQNMNLDHASMLAADRKKTKEIEQKKRDESRAMLYQSEMEKEKANALRKQTEEQEREKKMTQAKLMDAVSFLSLTDKALLQNILTPGKHPNITDKQLEGLFIQGANTPKLPPFSIKQTAKGFQVCFNDVPVTTLDRQHGSKSVNERDFNAIREKFAEFDITAETIAQNTQAPSKKAANIKI